MKNFKRWLSLLFILTVILPMCGCSALVQKLESPAVREYTEDMLDALIENDLDGAYDVVSDVCSKDEFATIFDGMRAVLGNTERYELELLSAYHNTNFNNSEKVGIISSSYKVTAGENLFVVDVQVNSKYSKLAYFNITPFENTDFYSSGNLTGMKDANWFQWTLLLTNLVAVAFAVYMLVDCIKNKIKLKALWIILIILGFVSFGATFSESSFYFNFAIGWINTYSSLIRYGGGAIVFRIMFPIGSIVYCCLKKKLKIINDQPMTE